MKHPMDKKKQQPSMDKKQLTDTGEFWVYMWVANRPSHHCIATDLEEDHECDADVCDIASTPECNPVWVGCDCGLWFHVYCLGLNEPDEFFTCDNCIT